MHQKKVKKEKDNSERWLLTYSDLMNLLMILFILLYAMSSVDQAKYDKLAESLNSSLGGKVNIISGSNGVLPNEVPEPTPVTTAAESPDPSPTASGSGDVTTINTIEDMEKLKDKVDQILKEYHAGSSIGSNIEQRGLVISFRDNVFFDSGEDDLKNEMKSGLDKIALLLNRIDNSILVEGYTDNVPIKNSVFSSNWQLSSSRSANVVQYLVDKGKVDGSRLSAIGYGENNPIASNKTEAGRSKNRRINLVILYSSDVTEK